MGHLLLVLLWDMPGEGLDLLGEGDMFAYPVWLRGLGWSSGRPITIQAQGFLCRMVAGNAGQERNWGPARLAGMSTVRVGMLCHGVVGGARRCLLTSKGRELQKTWECWLELLTSSFPPPCSSSPQPCW